MVIARNKIFYSTFIACLFVFGIALAQPQRPGRLYNPNSVITVAGEVTRVEQLPRPERMGPGTHIILKTGGKEISVHLGPSRYLYQQGLHIAQKDKLRVTGSKVTLNNETFIIASKIQKNGQVVVLRDHNGFPMWRGSNW